MSGELIQFKDNIYFDSEVLNKLKGIIDESVSEDSVIEIAEHFSKYSPNKNNIITKKQ